MASANPALRMRALPRLSSAAALLLASFSAAAQTEAPAPPQALAPRPTFSMGASLGTGVSFTPLELSYPVSERVEVAAALGLGGLMRRRNPSTELETRTLTKLRYTSIGDFSVGARGYAAPGHVGGFLGGGASVRHYVLRATTTEPTLLGTIGNVLLLPLAPLGGPGFDDISVSTSGFHVGGYVEGGYAYATRRGRRHAFGFRFDFAPVGRTHYMLTDEVGTTDPAGRLRRVEVERTLGQDFGSAGLGLRAFFRFGL